MAGKILKPRPFNNYPNMSLTWNESVINSKILANYFRELCENFSPPYKESSDRINLQKAESNNKILNFLSQMHRLIQEEKCDSKTFIGDILTTKNLQFLQIEIFWYLEISKLITLKEVISYFEARKNMEVVQNIGQQIYKCFLELQKNNSKLRREILIDYSKVIFVEVDSGLFKIILDFVISDVQQVYLHEEICDEFNETNLDFICFLGILTEAKIEVLKLKFFILKILTLLLQGTSATPVKGIFKKQEKNQNVKHRNIFKFFLIIAKYLESEEVADILKTQLYEHFTTINWSVMFPFITFLGSQYENGWSLIKLLTNNLIKESLKNSNLNLLSLAFILARQACFDKPNNIFPSYLQWFSTTFSSESKRPLNSKQACSFFFNFLTDLVPYDSTYYLKVHINRCPWVPMDCQEFLNDYVTLVKTQLEDLNVSTELGICENTSDQSAAVFDVEKVMKHFEGTNEILNSVFQASMFCKQYYEKKFLTELLSKFDGKKSVRHRLIMKLNALGKIPNVMFKKYKTLEKK